MSPKKIPMRMCCGCGQMFPKKQLCRVVKSPEGAVSLDLTGKKSGRGAYICRDLACLKKARKQKRIERNLDVAIPPEVYALMEEELGESDE